MKITTLKLLILCILGSLGWNATAQEEAQAKVIVLQNISIDTENTTPESAPTSETTPKTNTTVQKANTHPIYIVDGMQISDLNTIEASSIIDVTIQGNAIVITTINGPAIVFN